MEGRVVEPGLLDQFELAFEIGAKSYEQQTLFGVAEREELLAGSNRRRISTPETGEWRVQVYARNTFRGPQGFGLAVTGAVSDWI